jgi:enolase-phosphatase E1
MLPAVLMDIEGTTTDIAFVHEVLFPLARRALPDWVRRHADEPGTREDLAAVRRSIRERADAVNLDEIVARLLAWIDADQKETALKSIQGRIWREAYERGDVKSHLYPDVAPNLRRWRAAGSSLYVFSSGSVEAQQLIFRHSLEGDLTPLIVGYFDTTTGPKRSPDAYRAIARAIGRLPGDVLFLSDAVAELDAARVTGMRTMQLLRPGSARDTSSTHPAAADFDEVSRSTP